MSQAKGERQVISHGPATLLSRRMFIAQVGAAVIATARLFAEDDVPADLDHILLGVDDLDRGIAWVEQRTGVRAIFGGVHPGRGTRNALVSLGPRRYLEIIAPDPRQQPEGPAQALAAMREPRLFNWAVHTNDIAGAARKAVAAGFAIDGPADGSRTRPDGKVLRWKACRLKDDSGGLLPFFIEWSPESVHPAVDAPSGCILQRFFVHSPEPLEFAKKCHSLGVEVAVEKAATPLLQAVVVSPKGRIEM